MTSDKTTLVISLSAELSSIGSESSPTSWMVNIDIDGNDGVALKDPLNSKERTECAWYLQQYAQQSPFSVTRAEKAANMVSSYARNIIVQLGLDDIVKSQLRKHPARRAVLIEVSETPTSPEGTIHQLCWELLEDVKAWELDTGSDISIRVRRVLGGSAPSSIRATPLPAAIDPGKETINILLVVARDLSENASSYEDISPFISSGILTSIKNQLMERKSLVELNIEVVRPGTFSALQEHLGRTKSRFGVGYYSVVHFDMHGAVKVRRSTKSKAAFLYFDHPQEERTMPVDADKVGALLKEHMVRIAVLNACESARANAGDDANIAKVFYRHGVHNVLAMSFKVSSHASEMFLGAFYHALIVRGQPFSQSAATARSVLRQSPTRHARFGLELAVSDWFIPVTYSSTGSDELSFITDNAQDHDLDDPSFGTEITPMQGIFGREFDLLRLEKALTQNGRIIVHGPAGVGKSTLLKLGCSLWRETGFMDSVVYLDFGRGLLNTAEAVMKEILVQLESSKSNQPLDTKVLRQTLEQLLNERNTLLVLDNLHEGFSTFPPPICPVQIDEKNSQDIQTLLNELFDAPGSQNRIIMSMRRQNQSTFEAWPDARPFELQGLSLAAGMELVQHLFKQTGLHTEPPKHSDLDTIELVVTLLDGFPAAIHEAILMAKFHNIPLSKLFNFIHQDKLMPTLDLTDEQLQAMPDCPYLSETANLLFVISDQCATPLINLTSFWLKGPFMPSLWDDHIDQHVGNIDSIEVGPFALRVAMDRGLIKLESTYGEITWVSPLLTLAGPRIRFALQKVMATAHQLRQIDNPSAEDLEMLEIIETKKMSCKAAIFTSYFSRQEEATSNPANEEILREDLLDWFSQAAGFPYQDKIATTAERGIDVGDMRPIDAPYLFNMLTLIHTSIATPRNPETWPWTLLSNYSDSFVVIATPSEAKLAARYHEKLVLTYFNLNQSPNENQYALAPDNQGPILHIIQFLIRTRRKHGHLPNENELSHKSLQQLTEDILAQSEAKYGPFTGYISLYEKGYILRVRIIEALSSGEQPRSEILEPLVENFLAVDAQTSQALAEYHSSSSKSTDQTAKNQLKILQTYHATRRQVLTNMVLAIQNSTEWDTTQTSNLEAALDGMSTSLRTIKSTNEESGFYGVDKDPQTMPPNGDMLSSWRKYDTPKTGVSVRLQDLETAADSGEWTRAVDHHEGLLKKALEEVDLDEVLVHIDRLIQIAGDDEGLRDKVGEWKGKREYVLAIKEYFDALGRFADGESGSDWRGEAAGQARDAVKNMLNLTKEQSGSSRGEEDDEKELAAQLDVLNLSAQAWDMEATNPSHHLSSNSEKGKSKATIKETNIKPMIKLLLKHTGDKSYLSRFTALISRIINLHLVIQMSQQRNDFDKALGFQKQLEDLAFDEENKDFAPLLIDLPRLSVDRSLLEWKRDWVASMSRWKGALDKGDWAGARREIQTGDELMRSEVAKEVVFVGGQKTEGKGKGKEKEGVGEVVEGEARLEALLARKMLTERGHWTALTSRAKTLYDRDEYDACIEMCEEILGRYKKGEFDVYLSNGRENEEDTREGGSGLVEEDSKVKAVKVMRALAFWNRDFDKCRALLMLEDFSGAAEGLKKLLESFKEGSANYKEAGGKETLADGLKAARLALSISSAHRDLRNGEWLRCIQTCDEVLRASSLPEGYSYGSDINWAVVVKEDAKVAYHNNEQLKADYEFRYDDALGHIDKLKEIVEERERTSGIDRSDSIVQGMTREMVEAIKVHILQKKNTFQTLGPVMGRLYILGARAAMGYQPQFRP